MRLALSVAAATIALATPAYAQDSTDAPFSGLYIGAVGGYDVQPNDRGAGVLFDRNLDGRFGETVTTAAGANAFSTGFCNGSARTQLSPANGGPCRNDDNGFSYAGRVGLDSQMGNIVIGAVAEFGDTEITDATTAFSTTPASYVFYRNIDWEGSVRGRVGYAANTTLFYGTFGAGYARIDRAFASTNTANAYALTGSRNQFGILGGGGIEQKISDNISIGLEYMYHQYQDDDLRVRVSRGTAPANNPFVLAPNTTGTDMRRSDDKFRWSSMRATVGFRF